jgi:hypothetical protein
MHLLNTLNSADQDDASVQIDLLGVPWLMISEEPSAAPNSGSERFAQIEDQSRCVSRGSTPPRFRSPI